MITVDHPGWLVGQDDCVRVVRRGMSTWLVRCGDPAQSGSGDAGGTVVPQLTRLAGRSAKPPVVDTFDPAGLAGPAPLLRPLRRAGLVHRLRNPDLWDALATAIIRQVIRAGHARSMYRRFCRELGHRVDTSAGPAYLIPDPQLIAELPDAAFTCLGMAFKKSALRTAARAYLHDGYRWAALRPDKLLVAVQTVPRIGPWTAGAAVADYTNDYSLYPFADLAVRTWAAQLAPTLNLPGEEHAFAQRWHALTQAHLACLVAADRFHHLEHEIRPRRRDHVVICDRYVASSYVLQRMDGVDIDYLTAVNSAADVPDLDVILTADPHVLAERIARRGPHSRFEQGLHASRLEVALYAETVDLLRKPAGPSSLSTPRRSPHRTWPRRFATASAPHGPSSAPPRGKLQISNSRRSASTGQLRWITVAGPAPHAASFRPSTGHAANERRYPQQSRRRAQHVPQASGARLLDMGRAARRAPITVIPQPTLTGLDVPPPTESGPRRTPLSLRYLGTWSRHQVARIARATHTDRSSELMVYSQAAKLVEEVGELHAELLGRSKRQRRSKTQVFDQASLAAELADVVLATAVLAEILGVNLDNAVSSKIQVIDARTATNRPADAGQVANDRAEPPG